MLKIRSDISDGGYFHFYETIKYYEVGTYQINTDHFGKWLVPSKDVGLDICYRTLKEMGI